MTELIPTILPPVLSSFNSDLQLRFLLNSEGWNEPDVPPLKTGITYIYSIDVIADVGEGVEPLNA